MWLSFKRSIQYNCAFETHKLSCDQSHSATDADRLLTSAGHDGIHRSGPPEVQGYCHGPVSKLVVGFKEFFLPVV